MTGVRARQAYLIGEGEDGLATRLAFGECRPEDGVFAVAPDGILEAGRSVDVAGIGLGSMAGSVLSLTDLDMCDLDLEWAEEDTISEADLEDPVVDGGFADEDDAMSAVEELPTARAESDASRLWRERACELEDELQWHRDELDELRAAQKNELQCCRDELESLRDALQRLKVNVMQRCSCLVKVQRKCAFGSM